MRRTLLLASLLLLPAALAAQDSTLTSSLRRHDTQGTLRVCADPDALPVSDDQGRGFENRLAELLAKTWNRRLEYAWWPVRRGFFSRALNGRYCDVALTAPAGLDMAGVTAPYYRSSYVIVTRKDSGLDLVSLADTTFRRLKIGVHILNSDAENTPPAMAMSQYGSVGNLVGFGTFYSDIERPEAIFDALRDRQIDVAVVWGPLAGYWNRVNGDIFTIHPVQETEVNGTPFAFSMGMATRRRDRALRDSLQTFIEEHRGEIRQILDEFGVPQLPLATEQARPAGAGR